MIEFSDNISNQINQVLFDSIPRLIAFLDCKFNFLLVNKEYAKADILRSKGDTNFFIGKNHFDLYPNEENKNLFEAVVRTGKSIYVYDKLYEYQDGRKQYFDWTLVPFKSGNIQGLVLTLVDVTERSLLDIELKTFELKLQKIIDNSNEGICILDTNKKISFCNGKFAEIFGFPDNYRLYNKEISQLLPTKQILQKNKVLNDIFPIKNTEIELINNMGYKKHILLSIETLSEAENKKGEKFLCYFIDITERKEYEEKLLNQRNELEYYSAFLAHDLRTNLTKIAQYSCLIKDSISTSLQNSIIIKESLDKIDEQVNLLYYMLTRTLELAKIGKIIEEEQENNLNDIFNSVIETLNIESTKTTISKLTNLPIIFCEKSKVYQLFLNILGNCLKHSQPTQILINFFDDYNQEYSLFILEYDGTQISDAFIQKFENNESFSGFGMLIIKKIIDAHRWTIKYNVIDKNNIKYNQVEILIPKKKIIHF